MTSPEAVWTAFEQYLTASSLPGVLEAHFILLRTCGVDEKAGKPLDRYHAVREVLLSEGCSKAEGVLRHLSGRLASPVYQTERCRGLEVVIVGAGPSGLRTAIECALLGCGRVVVLEKREEFTRRNILHLWPGVVADLKRLGGKEVHRRFGIGDIHHLAIWRLQLMLMHIALLLGVEVHTGIEYQRTGLTAQTSGPSQYMIHTTPRVVGLHAHVLVGAMGEGSGIVREFGLPTRTLAYGTALGITANFQPSGTEEEGRLREGGFISYLDRPFFDGLAKDHGIVLENIVYYRGDTHYFVMTVRPSSLLALGVLRKELYETEDLVHPRNQDRTRLLRMILTIVHAYGLPPVCAYATTARGDADAVLFDFTSKGACTTPSKIIRSGAFGSGGDAPSPPPTPQPIPPLPRQSEPSQSTPRLDTAPKRAMVRRSQSMMVSPTKVANPPRPPILLPIRKGSVRERIRMFEEQVPPSPSPPSSLPRSLESRRGSKVPPLPLHAVLEGVDGANGDGSMAKGRVDEEDDQEEEWWDAPGWSSDGSVGIAERMKGCGSDGESEVWVDAREAWSEGEETWRGSMCTRVKARPHLNLATLPTGLGERRGGAPPRISSLSLVKTKERKGHEYVVMSPSPTLISPVLISPTYSLVEGSMDAPLIPISLGGTPISSEDGVEGVRQEEGLTVARPRPLRRESRKEAMRMRRRTWAGPQDAPRGLVRRPSSSHPLNQALSEDASEDEADAEGGDDPVGDEQEVEPSLFVCVVGDALIEPFWPKGTGAANATLSALDAAWAIRRFARTLSRMGGKRGLKEEVRRGREERLLEEHQGTLWQLAASTSEGMKPGEEWEMIPGTRYSRK